MALVDKLIVGFMLVLQQMPRAVTVAPPSDEIYPPHVAEDVVRFPIVSVAIVGIDPLNEVVKLTCAPYEVPALFVA